MCSLGRKHVVYIFLIDCFIAVVYFDYSDGALDLWRWLASQGPSESFWTFSRRANEVAFGRSSPCCWQTCILRLSTRKIFPWRECSAKEQIIMPGTRVECLWSDNARPSRPYMDCVDKGSPADGRVAPFTFACKNDWLSKLTATKSRPASPKPFTVNDDAGDRVDVIAVRVMLLTLSSDLRSECGSFPKKRPSSNVVASQDRFYLAWSCFDRFVRLNITTTSLMLPPIVTRFGIYGATFECVNKVFYVYDSYAVPVFTSTLALLATLFVAWALRNDKKMRWKVWLLFTCSLGREKNRSRSVRPFCFFFRYITRCLLGGVARRLELSWQVFPVVLTIKTVSILIRQFSKGSVSASPDNPFPKAGPQPADIFVWQNNCNLMLHLTTKHVFEKFAGVLFPGYPPVCGPAQKCGINAQRTQCASGSIAAAISAIRILLHSIVDSNRLFSFSQNRAFRRSFPYLAN